MGAWSGLPTELRRCVLHHLTYSVLARVSAVSREFLELARLVSCSAGWACLGTHVEPLDGRHAVHSMGFLDAVGELRLYHPSQRRFPYDSAVKDSLQRISFSADGTLAVIHDSDEVHGESNDRSTVHADGDSDLGPLATTTQSVFMMYGRQTIVRRTHDAPQTHLWHSTTGDLSANVPCTHAQYLACLKSPPHWGVGTFAVENFHLAHCGGRLYFLDEFLHRVVVFDAESMRPRGWFDLDEVPIRQDEYGETICDKPTAVAASLDGRVFVSYRSGVSVYTLLHPAPASAPKPSKKARTAAGSSSTGSSSTRGVDECSEYDASSTTIAVASFVAAVAVGNGRLYVLAYTHARSGQAEGGEENSEENNEEGGDEETREPGVALQVFTLDGELLQSVTIRSEPLADCSEGASVMGCLAVGSDAVAVALTAHGSLYDREPWPPSDEDKCVCELRWLCFSTSS
jgi:hypothetical protein